MVEGLFAGYKLQHDAKWRDEYLVYDRLSYENWTGKYELPVHETKELYILGSAADSRDASSSFQFPVKDGDWKSMAEEANRYVRNRRYKKKNKPDNDTVTTSVPGSVVSSACHTSSPPARTRPTITPFRSATVRPAWRVPSQTCSSM